MPRSTDEVSPPAVDASRSMNPRTRLESNLASESEAYGYTLSVWGSGALLIDAFGIPGVRQAMGFVVGALVGYGVLPVLAFRGVSERVAVAESPSPVVVSTIHVLSTAGTLLAMDLFIEAAAGVATLVAFVAAGVLVTVAYNLLLLLEELAVEVLTR